VEKLKEYAGVIVAVAAMMSVLAGFGLWAIHVQINPEIRRLDGQYAGIASRLDRMDGRFEARFNRIEGEIKTIRDDIRTILLRLPPREEAR
jgi:hypothetical protein